MREKGKAVFERRSGRRLHQWHLHPEQRATTTSVEKLSIFFSSRAFFHLAESEREECSKCIELQREIHT
jgi:hypothetical protein